MKLIDLIEQARSASNAEVHQAVGADTPHAVIRKPAIAAGEVSLRMAMPRIQKTMGPVAGDVPAGAAVAVPVSAEIARNSIVAQAGAHVIAYTPEKTAQPIGLEDGVGAMQRLPWYFTAIEASPFAVVADGADVVASTPQVFRSEIKFDDTAVSSRALRFELPRSYMRDFGREIVERELMTSILLGLARAADHTLLQAIKASAPPAFTLAAAAAAGLQFAELKGVIGTAGAGGVVGTDGTLRLAGTLAELSDQVDVSLVGCWSKSAVAIHDSVRVLVERRSIAGDMTLTVFADMQPLIPVEGAFWTVA